jgi:hypothetical protein
MVSSGMLRRVALVRTDVSDELSAFIIRVTRIGQLGTTLAVTSNRLTLLTLYFFMYLFLQRGNVWKTKLMSLQLTEC